MKKNIIGIILISVLVCFLCACTKEESVYLESERDISETTEETMPDTNTEPAFCCVYVCGAVRNPGIYELKEGARIWDALKAAGGYAEDAADTACNLAEYVTDAQKVYVPTIEEAGALLETAESEGLPGEAGKVNLNTATSAQLMEIPGIGRSKADSILAYRSEHGRFEKIEDIMNITGIKEGIFEKIKDSITVD